MEWDDEFESPWTTVGCIGTFVLVVVAAVLTGFLTGSGHDQISTADGDQTIYAGDGHNVIETGIGDSLVVTGQGDDRLDIKGGDQTIQFMW